MVFLAGQSARHLLADCFVVLSDSELRGSKLLFLNQSDNKLDNFERITVADAAVARNIGKQQAVIRNDNGVHADTVLCDQNRIRNVNDTGFIRIAPFSACGRILFRRGDGRCSGCHGRCRCGLLRCIGLLRGIRRCCARSAVRRRICADRAGAFGAVRLSAEDQLSALVNCHAVGLDVILAIQSLCGVIIGGIPEMLIIRADDREQDLALILSVRDRNECPAVRECDLNVVDSAFILHRLADDCVLHAVLCIHLALVAVAAQNNVLRIAAGINQLGCIEEIAKEENCTKMAIKFSIDNAIKNLFKILKKYKN